VDHPVLQALEGAKVVLIFGKAIDWQDTSLMYALRATRRKHGRRTAFCINTSPAPGEALNLYNLGIQQLVVNMPWL
jgi:hypothetical protein